MSFGWDMEAWQGARCRFLHGLTGGAPMGSSYRRAAATANGRRIDGVRSSLFAAAATATGCCCPWDRQLKRSQCGGGFFPGPAKLGWER